MKVSKEMAVFIADTFFGESPGHMAMIPNNTVTYSIAKAYNLPAFDDKLFMYQYADFFIAVGEALKSTKNST